MLPLPLLSRVLRELSRFTLLIFTLLSMLSCAPAFPLLTAACPTVFSGVPLLFSVAVSTDSVSGVNAEVAVSAEGVPLFCEAVSADSVSGVSADVAVNAEGVSAENAVVAVSAVSAEWVRSEVVRAE